MDKPKYAGFWVRAKAASIDSILLLIIIYPLLALIYGRAYWLSPALIYGAWDLLLNYVFPACAVILFWSYKSATPGKMIMELKVVDAETLGKPTTLQLIGRYLGYYVAMLPFFLGIIWVAFDPKKQGWHDKLAGTVVIMEK